jgi:membrane-bound lytic murein transglycosylase D
MLAIAAYNAGTGRIMGALQKIDDPMHNRDFWYIYRMGYLAEETNEYIPRILALMIIDENQEYYGFKNTRTAPTESLYAEDDFIPIDDKIKLMANEN